ncbi:hypothetical protein [Pseudomonas phage Almagne]|nr:hypothetical protein [Pseudomonas phage Almagne]
MREYLLIIFCAVMASGAGGATYAILTKRSEDDVTSVLVALLVTFLAYHYIRGSNR